MLSPVLLLALRSGPAHGYSLLDALAEFELGTFDPSVVYRMLRDMEADGSVESTWDDQETQGPPRRVYRITKTGSEVLAEWAKELDRSRARIEKFLVEYEKGGA